MRLFVHPQRYAIDRFDPGQEPPVLASDGPLVSLTRTRNELSLVAPDEDGGWRLLQIEGPLDFDQVGVLVKVAAPLAEAQVSIFAVSTHDTDWVLVRSGDLDRAIAALTAVGHAVDQAQP